MRRRPYMDMSRSINLAFDRAVYDRAVLYTALAFDVVSRGQTLLDLVSSVWPREQRFN